jgi:hypothetical protein
MLRIKNQDLSTYIGMPTSCNSNGKINKNMENCLIGTIISHPFETRDTKQVSWSLPKQSQSRRTRAHPARIVPPQHPLAIDNCDDDNSSSMPANHPEPRGNALRSAAISSRDKEHNGSSDGVPFARTTASIEVIGDHINSNGDDSLEEGEIPDPVLRGRLSYDERLRNVSIQGQWDHGTFRLAKILRPEGDPEELFLGGDYSAVGGLIGYFSRPSNTPMATVAIGRTKEREKTRTLPLWQDGVEIRFSSLDNGNLRVYGKGVNEIGRFRLHGTATPSTGYKHLYEATITKHYDRTGIASSKKFGTNAPARRGYNVALVKKSSPSITTVTESPALPETPKQMYPQYCNAPSIRLAAYRQKLQEDTVVVEATPLAIEKHSTRESTSKEKSLVDNQFLTTISPKHFQRNILLLSHASSCKQGRRCQVNPSCAQLKSLWKHISNCKLRECEICESPNYTKYKNALSHFKNCKNACCNYCAPIRETVSSPERWPERHRQVQIKEFLQNRNISCWPAVNPMYSPRRYSPIRPPAIERTVKSATASTRLWNRYSAQDRFLRLRGACEIQEGGDERKIRSLRKAPTRRCPSLRPPTDCFIKK